MLRRLILAATVAVLPATLARAQITDITTGRPDGADSYYLNWGAFPNYPRARSPEDAGRDTEIEAKYNATIRNRIPDKKPSNDPWKTIRQAPVVVDRHRPQ